MHLPNLTLPLLLLLAGVAYAEGPVDGPVDGGTPVHLDGGAAPAPAPLDGGAEPADAGELPWKLVVPGEVEVRARARPGFRIAEIRAEMDATATPAELREVLLDEAYSRRTPYIADSRILAFQDANHWTKYTRLDFPIIDDRDYFIALDRVSDLEPDGSGLYLVKWKPVAGDRGPIDGVIRVVVNEGFWELRASTRHPGKTHVTYYLLSDPGGVLPAWLIDMGNRRVMPDILKALDKEALDRRAARGGKPRHVRDLPPIDPALPTIKAAP